MLKSIKIEVDFLIFNSKQDSALFFQFFFIVLFYESSFTFNFNLQITLSTPVKYKSCFIHKYSI